MPDSVDCAHSADCGNRRSAIRTRREEHPKLRVTEPPDVRVLSELGNGALPNVP